MNLVVDPEIVKTIIELYDRKNIAAGNTRIIRKIADKIEEQSGIKFIRMEIGEPGIIPSHIGLQSVVEALEKNSSFYPPPDGIPTLKNEISRFVKLFLDKEIPADYCIPTVGSINGCYASLMVAGRRLDNKDTVLFIDPGFAAQKHLVQMLGIKQDCFDVYDYRGQKLYEKLTEKLEKGNIAVILYSNPNNPAWICFTEEELEIIGSLATKYNAVVIEDLAYFAMDFRKDYSHPGLPPYQPTVARYTDNYILLISSSKSFSYAGQRIGMMVVSDKLFRSCFPSLKRYYASDIFGTALVYGTLLLTTGGVAQSVQAGFAEILRNVNDGYFNFVEEVRQYGKKAEIMKRIFIENGFSIVYDRDGSDPIGDGFYFTVSFPGFQGDELSERLLYYGISSIPLSSTGSYRTEGIRACVSLVHFDQMPELDRRLKLFANRMNEI